MVLYTHARINRVIFVGSVPYAEPHHSASALRVTNTRWTPISAYSTMST